MKNVVYIFLLVLCGSIISCKSPTQTDQTLAPTVTITGNNSTLILGDTLRLILHAAASTLKSGTVDFKDSTVLVFNNLKIVLDTTLIHIYKYVGTYNITASFTDGEKITTKQFNLTVYPNPPSVVTLSANKTTINLDLKDTLKIMLHASDSTLSSGSLNFKDGSIIAFSNLKRVFDTTIVHVYKSIGIFNVMATFTDGVNITNSQISITVTKLSPVVTLSANKTTLNAGDTLKVTLHAIDTTLSNGAIDFNDGTVISFNNLSKIFDTTVAHIYSTVGTFNVKATFSDGFMTTSSLLTITVSPQIVWTAQSSGTTTTLRHVCFTDANTGTIVGDSGIILRTINGGATWIKQTSGTVRTLNSVSFINSNVGAAVGDNGTILWTTDGGTTWISQTSGTTGNILAVSLADTNTGTAVGETTGVLHTTDGGKSWINQSCKTCPYPPISPTNVFSIDKSHVVTIGWIPWEFEILRTTDSGENWIAEQSFSVLDESYPSAISFCDSNTGIFVYFSGMMRQIFSYIYRTTDGGISWYNVLNSSANIPPLYDVSFTNLNNGTAVGASGTILHSTDGGITWYLQPCGVKNFLYGVSCPDANTGTVVGSNGTVLHTTKIGK